MLSTGRSIIKKLLFVSLFAKENGTCFAQTVLRDSAAACPVFVCFLFLFLNRLKHGVDECNALRLLVHLFFPVSMFKRSVKGDLIDRVS